MLGYLTKCIFQLIDNFTIGAHWSLLLSVYGTLQVDLIKGFLLLLYDKSASSFETEVYSASVQGAGLKCS